MSRPHVLRLKYVHITLVLCSGVLPIPQPLGGGVDRTAAYSVYAESGYADFNQSIKIGNNFAACVLLVDA